MRPKKAHSPPHQTHTPHPNKQTKQAKAGKLASIRTLGGHRRYRASEVYALLESHAPGRSSEL